MIQPVEMCRKEGLGSGWLMSRKHCPAAWGHRAPHHQPELHSGSGAPALQTPGYTGFSGAFLLEPELRSPWPQVVKGEKAERGRTWLL